MKKKILLIGMFFALALACIVSGWVGYNKYLEDTLVVDAYDHLEAMAHLRADHIETFLDEEARRVKHFGSDWLIRDSLKRISEGAEAFEVAEELNRHLVDNMMITDEDIYHLVVIDFEGNIIGTTYENAPVRSEFSEEIFREGREYLYVKEIFYDEDFRKNFVAFSAPIFDGEDFLGIVALKRTPAGLINLVGDMTSLRGTEVIYVINSEGYLLTPSPFLSGTNKGILTQLVDTRDALKCLGKASGVGESDTDIKTRAGVEISRDYRGEYVIGAHWAVRGGGWCVIAEVDEADVLSKRMNISRLMIWFGVGLILSIIFGLVGMKILKKKE